MTTQHRRHATGRTNNMRRTCAVVAAALAATLLGASSASAFTVGPGSRPGLAVDAAGTAYIAWNGPEVSNTTLRFCRLARGATACDAAPGTVIATDPASTSLSRPFVVVSGDRVSVVQYRYPTAGAFRAGMYRYTSINRGVSFGPGEIVGSVAFEEAAVGPGDTLSGLPINAAMAFQNVVLSGLAPVNPDGTSAVPSALLSLTHLNYGAVGLVDAATPLAVFTSNADAQFRRYDGSGSLNDVANWTAAMDIGIATYPKLAGGPTGLVLLAGDNNASLFSRKWNGSDFGAPAPIGPGSTPSKHLFQDAAGRLHAVFQRDSANPLQVVHAVSDDAVSWRSGTVATQNIPTDGGIADLRVATAADHIGVTVWHGGLGAGDVRVAAVGPDVPVPPPPPPPPVAPPPPPPAAPVVKPKPRLTATGSAKRVGKRFRISVKGRLVLPAGVAKAVGCKGRIKVTIQRKGKTIATKTVSVRTSCAFTFSARVARSKVKSATRLAIRLRFTGNSALAPVTKVGSIKVKR